MNLLEKMSKFDKKQDNENILVLNTNFSFFYT